MKKRSTIRRSVIKPAHTPLAGRVMERISVENIQMRSATEISMSTVLKALAVAAVFLPGLFFLSITFFKVTSLFVFGERFLLRHIPWFSTGLAVSFFMLTFASLEHFKVLYRVSLLKLAVLLAIVFVGLGFFMHKIGIHDRLAERRLSFLYSIDEAPLAVYAGRIIEVRTQGSFVVESLRGEKFRVYTTPQTRMPQNGVEQGQAIFIAGRREGDMIVAQGLIVTKSVAK